MGAAKGAQWALVPPPQYVADAFLEDAIQGADHFGAPKAPFRHSRRPRCKPAALQYTVRHLCPGVQFYIFLRVKMHSQLCNLHTQCHISTHTLLTI